MRDGPGPMRGSLPSPSRRPGPTRRARRVSRPRCVPDRETAPRPLVLFLDEIDAPGRPDPQSSGLAQLDGYLAGLGLDSGWLMIFERRPGAPAGGGADQHERGEEPGRAGGPGDPGLMTWSAVAAPGELLAGRGSASSDVRRKCAGAAPPVETLSRAPREMAGGDDLDRIRVEHHRAAGVAFEAPNISRRARHRCNTSTRHHHGRFRVTSTSSTRRLPCH
jgi:hypothetical protein